MKKKLESELMSIAHRILKLKGKEDLNKMHEEVSNLYEKLTILKFAKENFDDALPTIGNDSSFFEMLDTAFNNKISDTIEVEDKVYTNMDTDESEAIVEPLMEKIKDMVAQMPQESQQIDTIIEQQLSKESLAVLDFETLNADFVSIPEFEPKEAADIRANANNKKSLNDQLKGQSLYIDLNNKIAFIKHLFDGSSEDYNRVVSQINTSNTLLEAQKLISEFVKPDYNNWLGKETYELRFMDIIERKFN